jgi:hypothetical protein
MLRGALLGKSPLASTSFANLAINESHEATPNPTAPINGSFSFIYFPQGNSIGAYDEKFSGFDGISYLNYKCIEFTSS